MRATYCLKEAFSWLNRPKLRRYIWIPLSINMLIFISGTWWLIVSFNRIMNRLLPVDSWLYYIHWLIWPIFALILILVFYFTFSIVANIIAAPFNGFLAQEVERIETGVLPDSGRNIWREMAVSIIQEIKKSIYFILWAIPIILTGFVPIIHIITPLLWFLYTAWVTYLQYMDYPMANNGILFVTQRKILQYNPFDTFSFGIPAAILLTIPIINLIAMPITVIAATLHWSRNIKPQLNNNWQSDKNILLFK